MSLRFLTKFPSIVHNRLTLSRTQLRGFARAKRKKKEAEKCPDVTCGKAKRKPRRSIWSIFGSGEEKEQEEKPSKESCRRLIAKQSCQPDPDLSQLGDAAYRTCGPAYVVQQEKVGQPQGVPTAGDPEDEMLKKLERHPALKNVEDPMPAFESVEKRMLMLCELRLHPAYKKYMSAPKQSSDLSLPEHPYKSRSGPISDDEYPAHLKLSKECLDRKNIFAEFKRAEPPRQLLAKMLEIRQNERPTMEKKSAATQGKKDAEGKTGKS